MFSKNTLKYLQVFIFRPKLLNDKRLVITFNLVMRDNYLTNYLCLDSHKCNVKF